MARAGAALLTMRFVGYGGGEVGKVATFRKLSLLIFREDFQESGHFAHFAQRQGTRP